MNESEPRRAGGGTARRIGTSAGVALAIVVSTLVVGASPAAAHTASGPRPTNYLTSLGSISPRIPGVAVRVIDLGNKIEVTNHTPVELVVLGYDGEPYLRVGPHGVFENLRSPATYWNRSRSITRDVPANRAGDRPVDFAPLASRFRIAHRILA